MHLDRTRGAIGNQGSNGFIGAVFPAVRCDTYLCFIRWSASRGHDPIKSRPIDGHGAGGFSDFVGKPFRTEELLMTVARLLRK